VCARSSEGVIEENASGLVQERKADSERRKLRAVRNDNVFYAAMGSERG